MSSLAPYTSESGIELIINKETGESFATQAGYSRMSGIEYATVRKRVERLGSDLDKLKTAEMQTGGGTQVVTLIPAETVFLWLMKDNPELAIEMGKVGATVFLHKLAGYEVSSTATKPVVQDNLLLPMLEQLQAEVRALAIDKTRLDEYQAKEEAFDKAANEHKGCADVLVDEMENGEDDDLQMTTLEFMRERGIDIRHRRRLALCAANFQRVGKQVNTIPKINGQLILEVRYLRQAARFVLGL